ncbi:hypothetical protein [Cryptosporangium aurantiacum]|uniref:Uncharacterized protein n=1 Tax=Cryptosporangium aurantiacum TaxID=134849 RepID=A0A1M7RP48_9ACTN|nr:hypothetical protein [Cryptosporangium aurantiacum]SHN48034.1 hypothetical protein SAMN05443668_13233 [Cryptosporangium aurantiacum]
MSEIADVGRQGSFGLWTAGLWRRAFRVAAASAAWARAERHAFLAPPAVGAFHGEPTRDDGYLTMMRSTWGRP